MIAGVITNGIPSAMSTSDVVESERDLDLAPACTGSGGVVGSKSSVITFDEIPLLGIVGTLDREVVLTGVFSLAIAFEFV
jgi:hypothetical protein